MEKEKLVQLAYEAQKKSYSPYSGFAVGAALLAKNGQVFLGCNIENASYGATNCAERTALFKAVSEGVTEFEAIAIVGNLKDAPPENWDYCMPCGICRQALAEFVNPKTFKVYLGNNDKPCKEYTLEELLPGGFTKLDLL
ncbi:MAG: cytidine deaminase [Lachnospiraceae bacterium]|nr:cytidine deaminase [Lachnospiraceae bacterium]